MKVFIQLCDAARWCCGEAPDLYSAGAHVAPSKLTYRPTQRRKEEWILRPAEQRYTKSRVEYLQQSMYRPGQALRFSGSWGSQISRQSAHECGKDVSPTHRPSLPPGSIPGTHYVRGWVDPRATVRPEGLCQWKNPMTPSGIKRATFRPLTPSHRFWFYQTTSTSWRWGRS